MITIRFGKSIPFGTQPIHKPLHQSMNMLKLQTEQMYKFCQQQKKKKKSTPIFFPV